MYLGITQKINDLQTTYNSACDWKQNTGAGILESDLENGIKTVEGTGTHFTPLWDQDKSPNLFSQGLQSLLAIKLLRIPPTGLVETCRQILSSAQDAEDTDHNGTPTPATTSNSSDPKKKKKKKRCTSSTSQKSASACKSKGKKNPEDFYMQSMFTKHQAQMTKAQAIAAKAEFSYMKQLRELGLEFEEIKKMLEKEFPEIPDLLNESGSLSSSESSDDDT
ncbi:hypothetical protein VP01_1288g11 [Puccinia sorghi]|uniref:No apical meristem-associated C-terminal domain-containing protein n=1 Tax=Puccinia sorghi TaxID=27349 RepID=A0A0L6VNL5_9BASI|nr:hypothetical protein VP01_1288g11 [Puccinia sorghi]